MPHVYLLFNPYTAPQGKCHYWPHVSSGEAEAQRDEATCPRLHGFLVRGRGSLAPSLHVKPLCSSPFVIVYGADLSYAALSVALTLSPACVSEAPVKFCMAAIQEAAVSSTRTSYMLVGQRECCFHYNRCHHLIGEETGTQRGFKTYSSRTAWRWQS